jgi:tRNA pseudouridine38-40 synthase
MPVTESAQPAPGLQTWKLTLTYDGTGFRGWQVQPGEATIQGELQAALGRITGESPLPQGSGRTDAGVHALAQVASFVLQAPIPPENLLRALNRTLPPSIRILESRTVRSTFHARHSAVAKTYEYRVFRNALCPPFLARYVYTCPWALDLEALQASARLFEGEHDFLSFAASDPDQATRDFLPANDLDQMVKAPPAPAQDDPNRLKGTGFSPYINPANSKLALATEGIFALPENVGQQPPEPSPRGTVRTIFSSTWEQRPSESGDLLVYRVRGNGFLHHMVRNLVGTMLDAGGGRLGIDEIPRILAARSRAAAGPTAPARGLFLHSVEYDEETITLNTE